jgi:hypothetical protein
VAMIKRLFLILLGLTIIGFISWSFFPKTFVTTSKKGDIEGTLEIKVYLGCITNFKTSLKNNGNKRLEINHGDPFGRIKIKNEDVGNEILIPKKTNDNMIGSTLLKDESLSFSKTKFLFFSNYRINEIITLDINKKRYKLNINKAINIK